MRTLHGMGRLHSVTEASSEIRSKLHEEYPGLTIYESLQTMLESDVVAVVVAVPAPFHFEVARSIIESGKDVFIEKPMVLRVPDGEELVRLAEQHGRILMVGHLLIYQPAIRFIKESIDEGLIGKIHSYHQDRLNLGRVRDVENVLWSFGVHDIAVLLYLVGDGPLRITAQGQSVLQKDIEDDVYVHMEFADGSQAHLHTSWLWPTLTRSLTVIGETGMLVYDEVQQRVVHHRKHIGKQLEAINLGEKTVFETEKKPLTIEMEHFIECVTTRSRPVSDGRSAVEVLRVLEEAGR